VTRSRTFAVRPPEQLLVGPHAIPALLVRPLAPGPRPAIVAQHGYAADKAFLLPLAELIAQRGFVALLPDAWGHGERFQSSGPNWLTELSADYFLQVLQHTARDLQACVEALTLRDEVRADQIVLAGFSMGAMAALLAATWDDRTAGVVSASGSSPLDLVDISIAGSRLAGEAARAWAVEHDVVPRLGALAPRPLLLQHGRPDDMVPVANTLRLYDAARPHYAAHPEHLGLMLYEHTHIVSPVQIQDAVDWVCQRFADADTSDASDASDDGECQSA
jgi:dienelactone hydrolase